MNNRYIKKHLLSKDFKISLVMKYTLKWLRKLEIKKIYWLDQSRSNEVEILQQANHVISKTATTINDDYQLRTSLSLATTLYLFNDALIHTRSNNFLYDVQKKLIIERVADANLSYCDYSTGYVRFHDETHALIKNNPKKNITKYHENILYIGGNGVSNYYHWLIEIAPKLLFITPQLLEKFNIQYLLLDDAVEKIPSLQDILKIFFNHQKLKLNIIYKNHEQLSLVSHLFYINHKNNYVFNAKEQLSSIHFSYFFPQLIKTVRHICLEQLVLNPSANKYPEKVFLARKTHAIRAYNQEALLEYFEEQGFTPLYLEDYSFLEQVRIFHQARFIVGPTGAAWSNIIFSQEKTLAISWLPEQLSEFSVFSTLAEIVQCDMVFVFGQPNNRHDMHSEYSVPLDKIIELYQKMTS